MSTIGDQLAELEKQRIALKAEQDTLAKKISEADKSLQDSQAQFNLLNASQADLKARIETLERLNKDTTATSDAVDKGRKAAAAEVENSQKQFDLFNARLSKELSEEKREDLAGKLREIDQKITALADAATQAKGDLADAEAAVVNAQKKANEAEKAYRDTLTQLQEQPKQLDAARSQVAQLGAAAKSAIDAGRSTEAFALTLDLQAALSRLKGLLDTTQERQLATALPDQWQAHASASAAVKDATTAVGQARVKDAAAQRDYQAKAQQRSIDVKAALSSAPAAPAIEKSQDDSK